MYCNIVSRNRDFNTFYIIKQYYDKDVALTNFNGDIMRWTNENQNTKFFKYNFPFYYATIKMN